MKPFKRKKVLDNSYLTILFAYIHLNPWLYNTNRGFKKYRWSSYLSIISGEDERIDRDFVLDWFGGVEAFQQHHNESLDFRKVERLRPEDDF